MESLEQTQSKWENETSQREKSIVDFLASGVITSGAYDSLAELHFSGTNRDVFDSIAQGTAKPIAVNCYYEGSAMQQVHVVFDGGNTGQNIDVYLKGKALEDYLGSEN